MTEESPAASHAYTALHLGQLMATKVRPESELTRLIYIRDYRPSQGIRAVAQS